MPAAYGNRNRPYYRRFCPQSGCTTSTSDYRSRTQRSHPQIHRYGRLRRTNEKPRILHGICRSTPPKYSYPYRRLCKYRYNKLGLGDINGIPRVLDAGQCNDSYSLALIALKLKEIFGLANVNDLPIAFNIAWYEQKAVIVLLALLSLGFKNIHIGPTLPAFVSPAILNVLAEQFNLGGITDVKQDLQRLHIA